MPNWYCNPKLGRYTFIAGEYSHVKLSTVYCTSQRTVLIMRHFKVCIISYSKLLWQLMKLWFLVWSKSLDPYLTSFQQTSSVIFDPIWYPMLIQMVCCTCGFWYAHRKPQMDFPKVNHFRETPPHRGHMSIQVATR